MKSKKKGKENKDPKDEEKKELPKDQKEEKIVTEINVDFKDKYIRLYSEFENYRKRTAKEKIDIITNASENLLKEIWPVIDDFERAIVNNKEVKGKHVVYEPHKETASNIIYKLPSAIINRLIT